MPTETGNPPAAALVTEVGNPNRQGTESGNPGRQVTGTGNPPSVRLGTETGNPTIVANVGQRIQIVSELLGNVTIQSDSQPVWAQLREGNLIVREGEAVTGIFMAGSFQSAQLDRKDDI